MSDTFNLANSIWPNGIKVVGGHAKFYPLGTNKTNIPQTSSAWPKGNKLISPFVYQDDKIVGFCDTKAMVASSPVVIMPYEHIEADFNSIKKGSLQIHAPKATVKKVIWKDSGLENIADADYRFKGCSTVANVAQIEPNYNQIANWTQILSDLEDGSSMFTYNSFIESFSSDLSSLTNGYGMFDSCSNLRTFDADLSSLQSGYCMFHRCSNLTTFNSDLSSLTNGYFMFYWCDKLTTFNYDLSSLENGECMFAYSHSLSEFESDLSSLTNGSNMFWGCDNLTSFDLDLSSLTDGIDMFYNCNKFTTFTSDLSALSNGYGMFQFCSNLTTFTSALSSLTRGEYMFSRCDKLTTFNSDLSSLTNGSYMFYNCSLDTASVQNIADTINTYNGTIHIGIGNTTPNEQETAAFNKMVSKGWTVYVNGSSTSNKWTPTSLTPENGEETGTPIPFWAKPIPSDEEHAKYIDSEGNFFNILGGQFIYGDDISTYGMFTCEEDAAANMRLTPYVKPVTETTNNN